MLATAACMLAASAGLRQLRAAYGKYPNQRPVTIGIKLGHTDSLTIRSQGDSVNATHLGTAAANRGTLTDGGLLILGGIHLSSPGGLFAIWVRRRPVTAC
jgi:hypothetical protein